ncbi:MAG: hypothetical protein IPK58_05490 [Acidobacteria bacterium]|nr:hypothetical protein [Acidobacteriota bacterium]
MRFAIGGFQRFQDSRESRDSIDSRFQIPGFLVQRFQMERFDWSLWNRGIPGILEFLESWNPGILEFLESLNSWNLGIPDLGIPGILEFLESLNSWNLEWVAGSWTPGASEKPFEN